MIKNNNSKVRKKKKKTRAQNIKECRGKFLDGRCIPKYKSTFFI